MKFSTPHSIASWFYIAYDQHAFAGTEVFGLSVGRLYLGYYDLWYDKNGETQPRGWCFGWLDSNGSLIEKR